MLLFLWASKEKVCQITKVIETLNRNRNFNLTTAPNIETQKALALQDAKFATFMEELKQQREDIRRLHERQDAMQAKHDAEMHEMNQRFYKKIEAVSKEFTQQLHSNFAQTMIGVGAIMAAVGGLIIAALK